MVKILLAAACVGAAIAVVTDQSWYLTLCLGIACASTLAACVILMRASRLAQRIGRLNEQVDVLSSSGEAVDRGMTLQRWMQGYVKHSAMDRL